VSRPPLLHHDAPLLSNEEIAPRWWLMRVRHEAAAARARAGQFFMVRAAERAFPYLGRPFTLWDVEPGGVLAILYVAVGEGTAAMARMRPGETLRMLGPLGNSFTHPRPGQRAVFVAGGVGIAPFRHLARELGDPARWTLLLGGRSAPDVALAGAFEALGGAVRVATEDGTRGTRGLVTALLGDVEADAALYTCGPHGMLRAVGEWARARRQRCEVSVEDRMACGYGVCVACALPVRDEGAADWRYARACTEGPIFEAARLEPS
jgi:dihydroorotate dehydrogenase electron transfer subunit